MKTGVVVLAGALLMGCGGSSKFEVKLDATFDSSVSDATLATVTSFELAVNGDETDTDALPVTSVAKREDTLVFIPLASTRDLVITVTAMNSAGDVVAKGTAGDIEVQPGKTTSATVSLTSTASALDMTVLDLSH